MRLRDAAKAHRVRGTRLAGETPELSEGRVVMRRTTRPTKNFSTLHTASAGGVVPSRLDRSPRDELPRMAGAAIDGDLV